MSVGRAPARRGLSGLLLLVSCNSQETIRHDLEAKDWDYAFLQRLDDTGRPRESLVAFADGAASQILQAEDAAIVVFGLNSARLPQNIASRAALDSPDAIRFNPDPIEIRGLTRGEDQGWFGFNEDRTRLLLAPREGSPYLDTVGPLPVSDGPEVPAAFESTHVLSVPHQFGCGTDARLVPATDLRFDFPEAAFFSVSQLMEVSEEIAVLRARGGGLLRVRRGEGATSGDFYWPWVGTSTLAASPERAFLQSVDTARGIARIYLAGRDGRPGRETAGRLFMVELPLMGDLANARLIELTESLPPHPAFGWAPRLNAVAVSPNGAIVVGGGGETADRRRHGYLAVRGPGETDFTAFSIQGFSGSERVDVVTLVPGTEAVFALATTSGHVILLEHSASGWREMGSRYQHGLGGPAGGEAADWRVLRAFTRPGGFELWGAARPGLLIQRRVGGDWSVVGDEVRDQRLIDPSIGGCSAFGWLSAADFEVLEFVGDDLWIGARDCDSLLRVVFDEDRRVACVGAILPEGGASEAKAVDPGFFAVARWGTEVFAGGDTPLRLFRVVGGR